MRPRFFRRSVASLAVAGLALTTAPAITPLPDPTPVAHAQDTPDQTGGIWAILAMILGSLLTPPYLPGYVDMVGKGLNGNTATWGVSTHGLYSLITPGGLGDSHRIVMPTEVDGVKVGKPTIRNVEHRSADYARQLVRVLDLSGGEAEPEMSYPELQLLQAAHLALMENREDSDGVPRKVLELIQKLREARPGNLFFDTPGGLTVPDLSIGLLDAPSLMAHPLADGQLMSYSWENPHIPFKTDQGQGVRLLSVGVVFLDGSDDIYAEDFDPEQADRVVWYQPIPEEVTDVGITDLGEGIIGPASSAHLTTPIYTTTVSAEEWRNLEVLPTDNAQQVDVTIDDLEDNLRAMFEVLSEFTGIPYDGTISADYWGFIQGGLVLPKATEPLDIIALEPEPASYNDHDIWDLSHALQRAGTHDAFVYEVSLSESGDHWIIDYYNPDGQVEFDVESELDSTDLPPEKEVAVPAQVYSAAIWAFPEDQPELEQNYISYLDFDWGRGVLTPGGPDVLTDGVVRGTLDVPALPDGVDAAREYSRGVFGNPQCVVTRPVEDPTDFGLLASTRMPTDFDFPFPGQTPGGISSDSPRLLMPTVFTSSYIEDLLYYGGYQWSNEDACDQAAVLLKEDTPVPSTAPTTEPSEPSTEPSVPSTEPSEPTTEPSEPSTEPSVPTTEPSEPTTEPGVPTTEPSEPTTEPGVPPIIPVPPVSEVPVLPGHDQPVTPAVPTPGYQVPATPTTPQEHDGESGRAGLASTGASVLGLVALAGILGAAGVFLLRRRQ